MHQHTVRSRSTICGFVFVCLFVFQIDKTFMNTKFHINYLHRKQFVLSLIIEAWCSVHINHRFFFFIIFPLSHELAFVLMPNTRNIPKSSIISSLAVNEFISSFSMDFYVHSLTLFFHQHLGLHVWFSQPSPTMHVCNLIGQEIKKRLTSFGAFHKSLAF